MHKGIGILGVDPQFYSSAVIASSGDFWCISFMSQYVCKCVGWFPRL